MSIFHLYQQSLPLYIFGQSYGGKMGAAAAQYFHQRIQDGDIEMNLAGFAMGNAWIHPVDSTINWGEFLYWMVIWFTFHFSQNKLIKLIL